jgi:hypothetical protein
MIGPDAVRYFIMQEDGFTAIRTVVSDGDFDADGYQELRPGETFLGQDASTLAEGVYDGEGRFLESFRRRGRLTVLEKKQMTPLDDTQRKFINIALLALYRRRQFEDAWAAKRGERPLN